jgi:serine protease inhibitor
MKKAFILLFCLSVGPAIAKPADPFETYAFGLFSRTARTLTNENVIFSLPALRSDMDVLFGASGTPGRSALAEETGFKAGMLPPITEDTRALWNSACQVSNSLLIPSGIPIKQAQTKDLPIRTSSSVSSVVLSSASLFDFRFSAFLGEILVKPVRFASPTGLKPVQGYQFNGFYSYYNTTQIQAVSLPDDSGRFTLILARPGPAGSVTQLYEGLSTERIAEWSTRTTEAEGYIFFPTLTRQFETRPYTAFKPAGLGKFFKPKSADFSRMSGSPLYLGDYLHRIRINFRQTDEPPLPAYDDPRTFKPHEFFNFIADGPFLVVLRDTRNGSILLIGLVRDP